MHSCWTGAASRGRGGVRRAGAARGGRSRAEAQIWRILCAVVNFPRRKGTRGSRRGAAAEGGTHLGGVLEAAIHDGAEEFGLEQEIAEAGGVDADVALLHSLASLGARGVGGSLLLLLVIEELLLLLDGLFVGHLAREKRGVTSDDACDRGARVLSDARNADRALDTIRDDGIASPSVVPFSRSMGPDSRDSQVNRMPIPLRSTRGTSPRVGTACDDSAFPREHERSPPLAPLSGSPVWTARRRLFARPRTRARGPRGCPRGRRAHARPPRRGARDRLPRRGDAGVGARRAAKGSRAAPRVSGGQVARGGCARAQLTCAARRGVDPSASSGAPPASSPAADAELRAAREEVSRLARSGARARGRRARLRARVALERADSGPSALADRARASPSAASPPSSPPRARSSTPPRDVTPRDSPRCNPPSAPSSRRARRVHAAQLASAVEAARAEHADTLKDARTTATAAKAKAKAALDAARRAVDDARNERTRADDAEGARERRGERR